MQAGKEIHQKNRRYRPKRGTAGVHPHRAVIVVDPSPAHSDISPQSRERYAASSCLQPEESVMAFTLPPLPYDYKALEPHIDEQTMRIHHDKHHAAYVNNLNAALEPHADLQKKSIDELLAGLDKV